MPSICALVLVMAVDAVRRKRKALVSSRAGLSGVVGGDDIVVKADRIIFGRWVFKLMRSRSLV